MTTPKSEILSISKVELDEHFKGITGDSAVDYHYLSDCLAIEQAMSVQEKLVGRRWATMEEAEEELDLLVATLEEQAMEDDILGQYVTLTGETLQLPEAHMDPSRREVMQTVLNVDPSEPDERLVYGASGKLGGFHYVMSESDDGTGIKAHLVYQVGQGSVNTPNGQLLLMASAAVGHSTSLEFASDRQNSDIHDAYAVFQNIDEHITNCGQQLHDIVANREKDYSAHELRRIGLLVAALTTFDVLSDKQQQVIDSLETILSELMIVYIGYKQRVVTHTAGYYQHYIDEDFTKLSALEPYRIAKEEEPLVSDLLHITEFALMPSQKRVSMNGVKSEAIPYEPHLIVRSGVETFYVALTSITDIT